MNWDQALRLRHIKCFLEVARVESVSLAAASLNITQPAVSKTIKELEELLQTPLFDRVGRRLQLNEQGRIFQNHAAASWLELSKAKDRLSRETRRRELRIGSLPTAATELVPDAVLTFSKDTPNSQLKVRTGPNWMLFNQLRDGQLDLVVGRMPDAELLTDIAFEQFYSEDVVCVVRPDHPILFADHPSDHFLNYPLVMPP
ncbi:MAG: LysR family transcriptional regulator, partial [Paracoccaceae bacterium]